MFTAARTAAMLTVVMLTSIVANAATPKEIDAAIKKGSDALKARYTRGVGEGASTGMIGIGGTCLAGLAILEAGAGADDPAVKHITSQVRNAAYGEAKTYHVALSLMYLDRLGDPNDVPLIQALSVRLLAGQTPQGGWGYEAVATVPGADQQRLRAMQPGPVGKLHPEVEKYAQSLAAARAAPGNAPVVLMDDNSNTQFAVMAVWMSRKHGVPVDGALDLVEKRYLATQSSRTGGWPYNGPNPNLGPAGGIMPAGMEGTGSPSMHCAGLLGLATGIARREERRQLDPPKKDPPKSPPGTEPKKSDDPFFTPPKKSDDPKKPGVRPLDARDRAAQFALAGLGVHIAECAKAGRGALALPGGRGHGHYDLYFLWSVERVGVVFGVDKLGGVDWHEAGAETLVRSQGPDGNWPAAGYGSEVSTSFAVLFLAKSNLARDLAGKVQKETATEMKAGPVAGLEPKPSDVLGAVNTKPDPLVPLLPGPTGSEAAALAGALIRSADKDWATVVAKLRDSKGPVYTQALLGAVYRLDGQRRAAAREALAERLTRMTATTLREMAKNEDGELRRGAVLAMAMKDNKTYIPDLIAALSDDEDLVVRAARAGLKSLTGEDFGPGPNATAGEKKLATDSWTQWLSKQKK